MRHKYLSIIGFGILIGCSAVKAPAPPAPAAAKQSAAVTPEILGTGTPTPANQLDVATDSERAAAADTAQNSAGTLLGVTVAALGNPAQTGFWLKTALVDVETKGGISSAATSTTVNLTLIPLEAASGSQLSLSAMRMLDVPLTALVEVRVYKLASE